MERKQEIFCFGSNLGGRHIAGAARYAFDHHHAIWGQAIGIQGQSYAIPSMDESLCTLSLHHINKYVSQFIAYAMLHPELDFKVTAIGCGIAGYKAKDIASMFSDAPDNCSFDQQWAIQLPSKRFWS